MSVPTIISLIVGGSIGSLLRMGVSSWIGISSAARFPLGTLSINLLGCFLIGVAVTLCDKYMVSPVLRAGLISGGLGAFTTFSTFGLEIVQLLTTGHAKSAIAYVMISTIGGLLLVIIGMQVAR